MPGMPGRLDLFTATAPDLFGAVRSDTGDTNFGAVSFGDPFPTAWPKLVLHSSRFTNGYIAPGATTPVTVSAYQTRIDPMSVFGAPPGTPYGANLSPVLAPRLGSADAFTPQLGVGATPQFSWSPPSVGTPDGYILNIFELVANDGNSEANLTKSVFTTELSARVPPGILVAGHMYFARITAFLAPGAKIKTTPFRRGVPNAYSNVLTATFTP
jgi:hypothetical protein